MENVIESKKPTKFKYPEGSILFDVRYYDSKPETFEVIYWDPYTKRLELKYEPPIVDIWFLKPEERTNQYQISHVDIDRCYPFYCKPSQISKVIAQEIGGEYAKFYDENHGVMSSHDLKSEMCKCPWVFKADFEPTAYFRLKWINQYGLDVDISKVAPGYLDIECDVIDRIINPSDYTCAPQPINAITIIFPHVKIAALLALGPRPKNRIDPKFYDLLEKQREDYEWIKTHMEEFKHDMVYGDEENVKYMEGFDVRVHLFDFDDEIYLIKTVFDYINKYRPWFVLSWNAPFDDNYIWNRIKALNYDPREIMIPPEFKTSRIRFHEDTNTKKVIKTARDWFDLSTYPILMCQERTFAAIRKSQQERRSYKLDAVAREVAGIGKSRHFDKRLAYTNLQEFLKYNFRDVVAQYATELATRDCGTLVSRAYTFATQYSKCFQETHTVRNSKEYYYEKYAKVIQACRLLVDRSIDGAFKGAFVADPALNDYTGLVLNAKFVNNIIYGVVDFDAKAYYPSSKMACNLNPMTLRFKCVIDNSVFQNGKCTNLSMNQTYVWGNKKDGFHPEDMAGPIFNSVKNGNILSVIHNWFNVPSITDIFNFLDNMLGG